MVFVFSLTDSLFCAFYLFLITYVCFWPEIHRFLPVLFKFFRYKCPDCQWSLESHTFHNSLDMPVYKCQSCGKEWI